MRITDLYEITVHFNNLKNQYIKLEKQYKYLSFSWLEKNSKAYLRKMV